MKALVTGATGFVGRRLLASLDRPVVLSRNPRRGRSDQAAAPVEAFAWDPLSGPPPAEALQGIDAVFHLAGEPVAEGRWTTAKKQRIRDSRVIGTRHLVAGLAQLKNRPKVLVSASAVGLYGSRGDQLLTEDSLPANDFLAEVCRDWEHEATAARALPMRVVPIRIGIVLGRGGGALGKMLTPFKFGLGSPLGSGRQYMPWIHLDDLVGLMLFAAGHSSLNEPLNGVAPHPVTNREFTKTLATAVSRPAFLPAVPGFALRLALGEFAQVLLASQRAIPQAAERAGYHFQYSQLAPALQNIVQK